MMEFVHVSYHESKTINLHAHLIFFKLRSFNTIEWSTKIEENEKNSFASNNFLDNLAPDVKCEDT